MDSKSIKTPVALQHCVEYSASAILDFIEDSLYHLQFADTLFNKTVLLKPNLISVTAPRHGCTDAVFIAAVAMWFLDQGARVKLGDSPAFGTVARVCNKQGITEALADLDVEFVRFNDSVPCQLPTGPSVPVSKEALDCDLLVGLPKLKAHNQLYVTLAVKNLFGTVSGVHKPLLHMTQGGDHEIFCEVILDLLQLFPRQIHLIDGIEAMHISGPMDGAPLRFGLVGASSSAVALDTSLLEALHLSPLQSPLSRVAAERFKNECELENLFFPFNKPSDFHAKKFIPPASLNPVRFNPFRFLSGMTKRLRLKLQT